MSMETIKERIDELLGAYVAGVVVAVDGTVTVPTHVMDALLNIAKGSRSTESAVINLTSAVRSTTLDRDRLHNDLTLLVAERDGLASVLAEVRDECVAQRKRADALQEHLAVAALKAASVPAPMVTHRVPAVRVVVDEYDALPPVPPVDVNPAQLDAFREGASGEPSASDINEAVRAATENAARLGEFPLPDPSLVETLYDSKVTLLSPTTFEVPPLTPPRPLSEQLGDRAAGFDDCICPLPAHVTPGQPWTCPRCLCFHGGVR